MKIVAHIAKLAVILLALPIIVLLLFEGTMLIVTDKLPELCRKIFLHNKKTSQTFAKANS